MTGPHLLILAVLILSLNTGLWLVWRRMGHARISNSPTAIQDPVVDVAEREGVVCHAIGTHTTNTIDPVLAVRQACLAMEDVARRHQVDLLRPYHVAVPPLRVERGPLVSLLKSVLQNSLEATAKGGAVICAIKLTPDFIHFVVSDSSGCAEDGAVLLADKNWRREGLMPAMLVAEALGGRLLHTDHPGEGAVIELAFARSDLENPSQERAEDGLRVVAGNDHVERPRAKRETFADRKAQ